VVHPIRLLPFTFYLMQIWHLWWWLSCGQWNPTSDTPLLHHHIPRIQIFWILNPACWLLKYCTSRIQDFQIYAIENNQLAFQSTSPLVSSSQLQLMEIDLLHNRWYWLLLPIMVFLDLKPSTLLLFFLIDFCSSAMPLHFVVECMPLWTAFWYLHVDISYQIHHWYILFYYQSLNTWSYFQIQVLLVLWRF